MTLSIADARRIAIAAQGLGARPAKATLRQVRGLFDAISLIQVDAVNVVCRSQELPVWARLGPHARDALPTLCQQHKLFEYWAHEASLLAVEEQPLLRWRMAEARDKMWQGLRKLAKRDPKYIQAVRDEVHARGTLIARELEPTAKKKKSAGWWGWDDRKRALAYLFWAGEITAIRSPTTFERVYAPLASVLPASVIDAPTPSKPEALRALLLRSARALGVATLADLADYFRIGTLQARPQVAALVAEGALVATAVEGWKDPAYRLAGAKLGVPRAVRHLSFPRPTPPLRGVAASTLLSPFDSLIWFRKRTERLFGFHYRIGIYTPAAKRTHGYYVLPFLLGDALVARVDLKAGRANGDLLVQSAYAEPGAPPATASELADELTAFARWLGLERVVVAKRGDLARALGAAIASR